MEEKLSKKELKELRKLQELERDNLEKRQNMVKWVVISVVSILFLGFFGFLVMQQKQKNVTAVTNVSSGGWVKGAESSKVTLVEFSDFQCPACRSYEPMVRDIIRDYDGKVKLVYKHFPITVAHKNALAASIAAEAAGKQGKFWEMHDLLFDKQDEWAESGSVSEKFSEYAKSLALDVEKFKKDSDDKELENKVNRDRDEGIKNGVSGTPTFFLNNKLIKNPSNYLGFKKLLDKEL